MAFLTFYMIQGFWGAIEGRGEILTYEALDRLEAGSWKR